ncbi:DUF4376 domain-containing protein [Caldimonas sp.]|uniref:DUF4376 domain-containing protein n=1 Tax=Caldimonas sp. TaxID=2838790 RepID=UPI00307CEC02
MLNIKNHTLLICGQSIQLPHLVKPATVKVWRVPTDYRADGIFVSVTSVGEPEEVPACDLRQCELIGKADLDPHPDAVLAEAKVRKKEQIEADRDAACVQPVTALGRTWQADKRSQELLASAITIAQAGGPLPAVWRDRDNQDMPVTSIADLLAIAGAIAAQTQAAYAASWARKAAVDAAVTVDDVDAA